MTSRGYKFPEPRWRDWQIDFAPAKGKSGRVMRFSHVLQYAFVMEKLHNDDPDIARIVEVEINNRKQPNFVENKFDPCRTGDKITIAVEYSKADIWQGATLYGRAWI